MTETRRFKSNLKIFVAIPWLYGEIYQSCLEHVAAQNCPVETMPPYYVPPPSKVLDVTKQGKAFQSAQNVNKYIDAFMKTDATHIWILDADIEVPPNALYELLKLDVDLASGVSFNHRTRRTTTVTTWFPEDRLKSLRPKPNHRFLKPSEIFGKVIKTPTKVATGAFCMLVKRRVFEKHHPRVEPPRFRWKEPQAFGPDLQFWADVQFLGFTAAVHGGVVCGHLPEHPLKSIESSVLYR